MEQNLKRKVKELKMLVHTSLESQNFSVAQTVHHKRHSTHVSCNDVRERGDFAQSDVKLGQSLFSPSRQGSTIR